MHETFEANPQFDATLSEISFSDKDGFTMEIVTKNKSEAVLLSKRLYGLRGLEEMDAPEKQNFEIKLHESNPVVKLTGNIFNAFELISNRGLISKNLASEIQDNPKVRQLIEQSKFFKLQENLILERKTQNEEIPVNVTTEQEKFTQMLCTLDEPLLRRVLSSFASSLSSEKGIDIKINVDKQRVSSKPLL